MPAKKKIIKRKVKKSDVKRIPKIPNVKPNLNISPFDLANMVQQKFRQDMDADNTRIQQRQKELQAKKKVIQSPEYQKALDENTKSLMSLQHEMAMFKQEQERSIIEAQRAFQNSPEFREMQLKQVQLQEQLNHANEMQRVESERMQANIIREIQSSQEAYSQRLEKAQLERETKLMKQMNDRWDKFEDEQAKLVTRKMEQKGEIHAQGLKKTQKEAQKTANETAKVRVETEQLDEQIKITKEQNQNIIRQAYLNELQRIGAENAKKIGEERAQQELEKQRLEREIEYEKRHQESLLESEIVAKQSKQIIHELQGHIQELKKSDPNSRLTGDPALLEADLSVLGDDRKKYEEAQRNLAMIRYKQHVILDMNKEVDSLATEIRDTGQGITFSELYGRNPSDIIRAMADLNQIRQGRGVLTSNLGSIFPAIRDTQRDIERRSQAIASRETELTQFESQREDLLNQVKDTNIINERLLQENVSLKQQLGMPT